MQTILGAGGAIGTELAKALLTYTKDIRLVSRNPKKVNETDEIFAANLLEADEVAQAVAGSDVVYVAVGFPYNHKVWKAKWPLLMENVIDACIKNNCKLVFFDNIYMYDPNHIDGMTEETPINPQSKKGKIRAEISELLLSKMKEGKIKALIARSADFYGSSRYKNIMLAETVFAPLNRGKTANLMGSDRFKHSYTYTSDAGKATALLGNSEKAFGQVWHLPTAKNPMNGKEMIEAIAKEMGVKPKYRTMSMSMVKLLSLFIPVMREMPEMMYQYDRNYVFNSDKFTNNFAMQATPFLEGIKEIVKLDYKQ